MSCGQIKAALPKAALRPPVAVLLLEAACSLKPYGLENWGHKRAGDIMSSFSPRPPTASLSIFSPGPLLPPPTTTTTHEDASKPRCPDLEGGHARASEQAPLHL